MAQEIKIPVSAQVDGAKKAAGDLETAFDNVGEAVGGIEQASDRASAALDRMVDRLEEVKRVQEALQRLGVSLSSGDAQTFLGNWDNMRSARGPATARVRQFTNFDSWWNGHEGLYSSPREAARHRRAMLQTALQGTDFARTQAPAGGDEGGGSGGGGGGEGVGGGGSFNDGLARAGRTAASFGKSMLALAGINSVMSMAGKALDMANEEAIGADSIKRRIGDLGVDFESLRSHVRAAGEGLGITFVELSRMGQDYARVVGNLTAAEQGGIYGALRIGTGLARSYGFDPEAGGQFFGTMAKYGVARDEQSQRRLALLIGDSVSRSGYSGKVDELLGAISDYTSIAARATLTTPNVEAYANALTSLIGKYAGMGPADAAQIIGQADSSVRRGGAMGAASQNFLYAAMRNSDAGISPLQAMALWQGGLFSSDAQIFGAGGPLAGLGPSGSRTTTLEKIINTVRRMGGNPLYQAANVQGITGLNLAQSAAFMRLQDKGQLGGSLALLQSAGVDPGSISPTSLPMIAQLAAAHGHAALMGIGRTIGRRGDLSAEQRAAIQAALGQGNDDDMRKALVKVVSQLDQQETKGSETRTSLADLNNTLTAIGDKLLTPLNGIRNAVVALAGAQVKGFVDSTGGTPVGQEAWASQNQGAGKANVGRAPLEKQAMDFFMKQGWTKDQAAGIVGNLITESNLNPTALGDYENGVPKARGIAQWHADRWNRFLQFAKERGLNPDDYNSQLQYVQYELTTDGRYRAPMDRLKHSQGAVSAAQAMYGYEAPKGWDPLHHYAPHSVSNWQSREGQAARLAGAVDVNINVNGKPAKQVKVPVSAKNAPKAAGTQPSPGSAPRVHVSYTPQDVGP